MKVRARVCRYEDIEVEVGEKYRPLSDEYDIWSKNPDMAENLSNELAQNIENSEDDMAVIYVEDMNGNVLFEG